MLMVLYCFIARAGVVMTTALSPIKTVLNLETPFFIRNTDRQRPSCRT